MPSNLSTNGSRPELTAVPLTEVLPLRQRVAYATMNEGQWDNALAEAYDVGFVLLELDDHERPLRAYQRRTAS